MNFMLNHLFKKASLLSFILFLSGFLSFHCVAQNPSVDVRFQEVSDSCITGQYCVNVQVQGQNGADLIGNSSIRMIYDETVVSFFATSLTGGIDPATFVGSYESVNFDNDGVDFSPECVIGGSPYSEHSFDGLVPGNLLITLVLLIPDIGSFSYACPGIENTWTDVSTICFEVLDPNGNPNLQFTGQENSPVTTTESGTNFSQSDNFTKYDNGSFTDLLVSANSVCNTDCDDFLITHDNSNSLNGLYQASVIRSTGEVNSPKTVDYKAASIISLFSDFSSNTGATFNAVIEDCNP